MYFRRVTRKHACYIWNHGKTCKFCGYLSEVCNLPGATLHLIFKLNKVYFMSIHFLWMVCTTTMYVGRIFLTTLVCVYIIHPKIVAMYTFVSWRGITYIPRSVEKYSISLSSEIRYNRQQCAETGYQDEHVYIGKYRVYRCHRCRLNCLLQWAICPFVGLYAFKNYWIFLYFKMSA